MEAACLNPLVILGSLVLNVLSCSGFQKGDCTSHFQGVSQGNWTAKLESHRGQAQPMPWYKALKWGRAFSGKLSIEKQVQVPQKLRECGSPLPFPEVSALCSSWDWTGCPWCAHFCRADLLSF